MYSSQYVHLFLLIFSCFNISWWGDGVGGMGGGHSCVNQTSDRSMKLFFYRYHELTKGNNRTVVSFI